MQGSQWAVHRIGCIYQHQIHRVVFPWHPLRWTPVAWADIHLTHSTAEQHHSKSFPSASSSPYPLFPTQSPQDPLFFHLCFSPFFSTHNWLRAVSINQFGTHISQSWMEEPPLGAVVLIYLSMPCHSHLHTCIVDLGSLFSVLVFFFFFFGFSVIAVCQTWNMQKFSAALQTHRLSPESEQHPLLGRNWKRAVEWNW